MIKSLAIDAKRPDTFNISLEQSYKAVNIYNFYKLRDSVIILRYYFNNKYLSFSHQKYSIRPENRAFIVPIAHNYYGSALRRYYIPHILNKFPYKNLQKISEVKRKIIIWNPIVD